MHRRFYSCYRVIIATTQSFTMIVGIVVIVVVTSRPDRSVNLVAGVAEKIKDFLDVDAKGSLVENFDLVREVMLYSYLLFTSGMILSALTRYVRQCKNMSMTMGGRLFLSLYFLCHLVARLTLYIAMFSTAESTDETKPSLSLLPSAITGFLIFFAHFIVIYYFKFRFVPNFQSSDVMERLVHALVNTLVAVPYMPWNVDKIQVKISHKQDHVCTYISAECFHFQLDMKNTALRLARRQSLPTPRTKKRPIPPMLQKQNSTNSFAFPNIGDALVAEIGDMNEKITTWWWENPSRVLSADDAVARAKESAVLGTMREDSIREIHRDLDKLKFINKELYNPQKTKMEYFWLIGFHFLFSAFALVLEIVNGGTYTKSGLYYSWDVRLGSFMMGIVFLLLYYKKYHPLRDLVSTSGCRPQIFCPIFWCCVKDAPLKAIPEEDVVRAFLAPPPPPTAILSPTDSGDGKSPEKETREIQTQTSLVSEKSAVSLSSRSNGAPTKKSSQPCTTVAEEEKEEDPDLPKVVIKER